MGNDEDAMSLGKGQKGRSGEKSGERRHDDDGDGWRARRIL